MSDIIALHLLVEKSDGVYGCEKGVASKRQGRISEHKYAEICLLSNISTIA
jgi:hypothetical protein